MRPSELTHSTNCLRRIFGGHWWATTAFIFLLGCFSSSAAAAQPVEVRLVRASGSDGADISGNEQSVHVGSTALIRVRVEDAQGGPLGGLPVRFELADRQLQKLATIQSSASGQVEFLYEVGDKEGTRSVIAFVDSPSYTSDRVLLRVHVRSARWMLSMLLGLAGGLALFLLGMDNMSSSLRRSAGGRLRTILATFTRNRIVGVLAGAVVTVLIQSSSATTVLLVSFVQAGILSFARTLGVILGADIGTTVTVQLISFKLTELALPTIALGFALRFLMGRRRLHNAGEALLGFGMLFFGLAVMADAMRPLRDYQPFLTTLHSLNHPLLGILLGTMLTALIQSSAAAIGIVIVLGQQGLLGLEQSIPLLLGANIGTCITALLASLRGSPAAKRVAMAHIAFKVGGVLLMVGWIPTFAELVRSLSGGGANAEASAPRLIANAHSLFNIGLAVAFLPFTSHVAKILERAIPDRVDDEEPLVRARFLDPSVLRTPELALSLAKVEILDLGRRVQKMADSILSPILSDDMETLQVIHDEEKKVDDLHDQVHDYLLKIGQQHIGRQQMGEVYLMMHVSVMFENMADVLDKELRRVAERRIREGVQFSERGRREIETYHLKMIKQIARALEAFEESSLETAEKITQKQAKYDSLEVDYRRAHFERLRAAIMESVASSEYHLDVMDGLQKVANHATNVARAMLATENDDEANETNV